MGRGAEGKRRREKLGRGTEGKGMEKKLGDGTGKEMGSEERERKVIRKVGREWK